MTRWESRLARYRNNPKNVSFKELKALLEAFGFEVNNYSGGSHFSVSHTKYDVIKPMEPNTIPMKRSNIIEVYVRRAIKWIDISIEMREAEGAVKNGEAEKTDD